jgi:hypothetical protein
MNASTRRICCCCSVSRKMTLALRNVFLKLQALCVIHTLASVPCDQFSLRRPTLACVRSMQGASQHPPLQQMSYYIVVYVFRKGCPVQKPVHLLPSLYKLDSYHYVTCPRIELRSGRHEYNFRFSRRSGRAVCQNLNDPRTV